MTYTILNKKTGKKYKMDYKEGINSLHSYLVRNAHVNKDGILQEMAIYGEDWFRITDECGTILFEGKNIPPAPAAARIEVPKPKAELPTEANKIQVDLDDIDVKVKIPEQAEVKQPKKRFRKNKDNA